ncbi:MAG: response regulator [Chloroflexi bacterium]|nr:response regulator [Chloroflexota bacterium]
MTPHALIVEDNAELSGLLADILTMMNIHADIAGDGRIATEKLAATVPDVVLLDMHIPFISGGHLLDQIRHDCRLADTRVLVITADALQAERARVDADVVFLKPVSMEQIQDILPRLVPGVSQPN